MNGIYNDLGFLVKNRLIVLVEAQSTWSPNIVIRALIYLMSTYQEYFNTHDINLYGTRLIDLPRPELYVIYTKERGNKPATLSLNELFFQSMPSCIDATLKVIYLDDSDTIVNQYIKFCMVLDDTVQKHGRTLTAIKETIRICRDENLLNEYLKARETEVEGIMITLFDQDRVNELWKKEIAEEAAERAAAEARVTAYADGIEQGIEKGKLTTYRELLTAGLITLEQLKLSGKLSISQLAALEH